MTTAGEQLAGFLGKYDPSVAKLAMSLIKAMRRRLPHAVQIVYDNYNALAIGFGPTERASDAIFSVAVFPRWVNLFFLQGAKLRDPEKRLQGSGNVVRYVRAGSAAIVDDPAVSALIDQALAKAKTPMPAGGKGRLIIKSISEKQRPRRAVTPPASPSAPAARARRAPAAPRAAARGRKAARP